jgi:hypothetical protein
MPELLYSCLSLCSGGRYFFCGTRTDGKRVKSHQVAEFSTLCTQHCYMEMVRHINRHKHRKISQRLRHQKKKRVTRKQYIFSFSKTAGYTCYSLMLGILRPGKKTHILAGDRILGLFASKKSLFSIIITPNRSTTTERKSCYKLSQ